MRRSDGPYLLALGLLFLSLWVGLGISSETHTTYINGSRVQSPGLEAVGNLTVGNATNASANSVTRIYANGSIQRVNTSTGAVLPLNLSNLSFQNSNLSIYPNGTIANAVMMGCNGCNIDNVSMSSGQYVGNDTVNRAIPHGLTRVPQFVGMTSDGGDYWLFQLHGIAKHYIISSTANTNYAVTASDTTNFYVGNAASYPGSGNGNGVTYYWTAWG